MSFFDRARGAAADEYGRRNYERYARRAKIRDRLFWLSLAVLAVVFYVIGHG